MGQQLRITFGNCDYSFQLLGDKPINREMKELRILMDDLTITLIKQGNHWVPKENNEQLTIDMAAAIGKAIELRFRI